MALRGIRVSKAQRTHIIMIASKGLVLILLALSSNTPAVADRAYSALQLSEYQKNLRGNSAETETRARSTGVDRRYSFDHSGRIAAATSSSAYGVVGASRNGNAQTSMLTKFLLLAALACYIKFLSPRAVHHLSQLCGEISEFKNSLEARSNEMFRNRRQKRRRSSCSSGGLTMKYRNGNHERNNVGNEQRSPIDPVNGDIQSMSSSVMEILGLADFGEEDDEKEDENDATNVDDESFISNNSTISTVSSFFSYVRSRRSAAASSVVAVAPTRAPSQKNTNGRNKPSTMQSSRMATDVHVVSTPLLPGEQIQFNNKGGRHFGMEKKAVNNVHTDEWLDDVSHIPTVTVDRRNDRNNHRKHRN